MSNSKLTKQQKSLLKHWRLDSTVMLHRELSGRVTYAVRKVGNNVQVATAIRSPNEIKSRPKVGEYYARERMFWEEYITLPIDVYLKM